jgi:hypothetical protein
VTEASVSVLFVAGAMIILGAANAVRRAVESGLEHKLLKVFGMTEGRIVGQTRNDAAKQMRVKVKERTMPMQLPQTVETSAPDKSKTLRARARKIEPVLKSDPSSQLTKTVSNAG